MNDFLEQSPGEWDEHFWNDQTFKRRRLKPNSETANNWVRREKVKKMNSAQVKLDNRFLGDEFSYSFLYSKDHILNNEEAVVIESEVNREPKLSNDQDLVKPSFQSSNPALDSTSSKQSVEFIANNEDVVITGAKQDIKNNSTSTISILRENPFAMEVACDSKPGPAFLQEEVKFNYQLQANVPGLGFLSQLKNNILQYLSFNVLVCNERRNLIDGKKGVRRQLSIVKLDFSPMSDIITGSCLITFPEAIICYEMEGTIRIVFHHSNYHFVRDETLNSIRRYMDEGTAMSAVSEIVSLSFLISPTVRSAIQTMQIIPDRLQKRDTKYIGPKGIIIGSIFSFPVLALMILFFITKKERKQNHGIINNLTPNFSDDIDEDCANNQKKIRKKRTKELKQNLNDSKTWYKGIIGHKCLESLQEVDEEDLSSMENSVNPCRDMHACGNIFQNSLI